MYDLFLPRFQQDVGVSERVSEQILNGTSAQLGYTVPWPIHVGICGKIQD